MSKSSNSGGMGCFFWFIIVMLVMRNCDQDTRIDKLEKNIEVLLEQKPKDMNF